MGGRPFGSPGLMVLAPLVLLHCGNLRPAEASGAMASGGGWLLTVLQGRTGVQECYFVTGAEGG